MKRRVIVLGTGVVAYGVIRECGEAGFHVIHVTTKPNDIASASSIPDESFLVEFSPASETGLLDFFLEKGAEWSGAFIIPVNDPVVLFTSKNLEALSAFYACHALPWSKLRHVVNKNLLYERANEIDVPAPRIETPISIEDLRAIENEVAYPCIIKPHQTPAFFAAFARKVHVINDSRELAYWYGQCEQRSLDVMVSEIIPGPESNLFLYDSCLDADGNVIADVFLQKVRQDNEYGVASVIKTIPHIEEIKESCLRLLRHLGFRGFSAVEVKLDDRDGTYKLIEINPRPVLYQRLFTFAGINISQILLEDYVEGTSSNDWRYEPGMLWMHNASELYTLKRYATSSEHSLKDFFAPYRHKHVYALPAFHDPAPLLAELRRKFLRWA